MTRYQKSSVMSGAWVDKSKLRTGMKAKIVSDTMKEPGKFLDEKTGEPKIQDVCKVKFEGLGEATKVALNRLNLNALIDAFGEDAETWQGNVLTVDITRRDGKAFLYLIPGGFKKIEDNEGYTHIIPEDQRVADPIIQDEEVGKVDGEDLPF